MARFVALYSTPDDPEGFEEHYRSTHVPLVQQWPGVISVSTTRFSGTPRGTDSPFHLMAVIDFASDEEMAAAMRSEAGMATARDAMAMAKDYGTTPTLLLGGDM